MTDETTTTTRGGFFKAPVTLVEILGVSLVVSLFAVWLLSFAGQKSTNTLELGLERLASTLPQLQMTQECLAAAGSKVQCLTTADYQIVRTAPDAWTISWINRKSHYERESLMIVTGGETYMNSLLTMDESRSLKREIIKAVTGKSVSDIAAEHRDRG